MKDIAIYGAGGFGREVACLIRNNFPDWKIVGFFDDAPEWKGRMVSHYAPCLGGIDALNDYPEELDVVIAIGSPSVVKKVVEKIDNRNVEFPNIIHPNVSFSDKNTFKIGKGNILQANCSMSCDVSVGDFNVLNGSVVFGHDVKADSYNTFMPAVRVSGAVEIGCGNFFGVGSIVLQQMKVGNQVRLGAGSVLMTKPKDGALYLGVPAKKMNF